MDFLGFSEIFQPTGQPASQQLLTDWLTGWPENLRKFQKIHLMAFSFINPPNSSYEINYMGVMFNYLIY